MKSSAIILLTSLLFFKGSVAQDTVRITLPDTIIHNFVPRTAQSPAYYKTSYRTDVPIVIGGIGLTYVGTLIIKNKKDLTPPQLLTKTRDKLPFFDRGNAGYYSEQANKNSYIPFYTSFGMPLVLLALNNNEKRVASKVLVMYLETMGITGTLFTMAAGIVNRSRPLVYERKPGSTDPAAPLDQRLSSNNQRSFFAGHTAATAAASFYAAKVFNDLNPGSKLKPYIWAISAVLPAVTGYYRYKGGYHFLSDNILGYVIGASAGILVPEFHKSKLSKNLSFIPEIGNSYKGIALTYHLN